MLAVGCITLYLLLYLTDTLLYSLIFQYSTEFWGAITLSYSMFVFEHNCFVPLREAYHTRGIDASFWIGPGFYAFIVCIFCNLLRGTVHLLTPMPGMAQGCWPLCRFLSCKSIKESNLHEAPVIEMPTQSPRAKKDTKTAATAVYAPADSTEDIEGGAGAQIKTHSNEKGSANQLGLG